MTVAVAGSAITTAIPASTAYSVVLPASITADGVLVIGILNGQASIGTASGWNASATKVLAGTQTLFTFWKPATGSEGAASAPFTLGYSSDQTVAVAVWITGANTLEAAFGGGGAYSTTVVLAGSTTVANSMVVGLAGSVPDAGTATFTPPVGYSEQKDGNADLGYRTLEVATILKSGTGAFSDTWTCSGTGSSAGVALVIPPLSATAVYSTTGLFTLGITGSAGGSFTPASSGSPPTHSGVPLIPTLVATDPKTATLKITGG